MGLVTLAPGVLIDRYHRGAVVLSGARSFAVEERVARLLDRARAGVRSDVLTDDDSRLLATLVEQGWVEVSHAGA